MARESLALKGIHFLGLGRAVSGAMACLESGFLFGVCVCQWKKTRDDSSKTPAQDSQYIGVLTSMAWNHLTASGGQSCG